MLAPSNIPSKLAELMMAQIISYFVHENLVCAGN